MRRRTRIALLLAAMLVFGLVWFLNSGIIERYALTRATQIVQQELGLQLAVGNLRIDWLRGQIYLGQVELRGSEPAEGPALLSVKQLQLAAGIPLLRLDRIDLRWLSLTQPRILILTNADGTTNLPRLSSSASSSPSEVRLGQLEVSDGELAWDNRRIPFALVGEKVNLRASYLPASHNYEGSLQSDRLEVRYANQPPLAGQFNTTVRTAADHLDIVSASLISTDGFALNASGELRHFNNAEQPFRADLDLEGDLAVQQLLPFFGFPLEPTGSVGFRGKLLFELDRGIELHGLANAKGLRYRDASTRLGPFSATAQLDLLPSRATLSDLVVNAFGGQLGGVLLVDQQTGWRLDSELSGVRIAQVLSQLSLSNLPWTGIVEGPLEAQGGKSPIVITTDLVVRGSTGPAPVEGLLALTYEEAGNRLLARNSFLALPRSRVSFTGDLARGLNLDFRSTRISEILPLAHLAGLEVGNLPAGVQDGIFELRGDLLGSLKQPRFVGTIAAEDLVIESFKLDRVKARASYGADLLTLDDINLHSMGSVVRGNAKAALEAGSLVPSSILSGRLTVSIRDLATLRSVEGLSGSAEITLALRGAIDEPLADGRLTATNVSRNDIRLDQLTGVFTASRLQLSVVEWDASLGGQNINGILNLKPNQGDWNTGTGNALVKINALPLMSLAPYRQQRINLNGNVTTDSQVEFNWTPKGISLSRLDGKLSLANITRFGRPVGQIDFTARTTGQRAALTATGNIRQQPLKGDATIQLNGNLATELRLQLPKLDFPTLAQLLSEEPLPSPLPYEGGAEASLFVKGPLLDPDTWDGRLTIPQLQLAPNKEYVQETMPTVADVVLRNELPIIVELRRGLIAARDVRFIAKDTNFITSIAYKTDSGLLDGQAKGTINLAVLSTLRPDLLATGSAALDATIQGQATDPQINGILSFQNASFYLRDVVTGLDKVNGTLLFDKNRAAIENLTAQAGGGDIQLSGFIGFGRLLSYRLQAQANKVRLRYPEGISTSANATLALTGTTAQSILTGTVSIQRSTIGQIDTGQLLSSTSGVTDATPIQNEFLRNLQFDVRLDAAQNFELSTGFTRDVKGEVALRLRGTPQRPVLLGRIAVTQGEIDFFGSRYQISRGEVNFNNPLRIEPIIGLDLETRVRGVVIAMNFSGPASKLNMSYRSDPPLQSQEILALLTVGRNPGSMSPVAQGPVGQTQGMFGNDSSVLVGAAVSAGISGRMQRFFGISRVRLDPQLTGIDNVPQARLTLEQQVSRDVTLTYITNLNRTQQQIVRIDWDISRTWSVVAVRDENGIFGLDLFFRRRLK